MLEKRKPNLVIGLTIMKANMERLEMVIGKLSETFSHLLLG